MFDHTFLMVFGASGRVAGGPGRRRDAAAQPGSGPPAGSYQVWNDFRSELRRSRRYGRSFVLIRVACGRPPQGLALQTRCKRDGRGDVVAGVEAVFYSQARSIDRVWSYRDSVFVLLPESARPAGAALIERISSLQPDLLPADGVRLVAFPEDGLTSGVLLAVLHGIEPVARRDDATSPGAPESDGVPILVDLPAEDRLAFDYSE